MDAALSYLSELDSQCAALGAALDQAAPLAPAARQQALGACSQRMREAWDLYSRLGPALMQVPAGPVRAQAEQRQLAVQQQLQAAERRLRAMQQAAQAQLTQNAGAAFGMGQQTTAVANAYYQQDQRIQGMSNAVSDAHRRALETANLNDEMLGELERNRETILGAKEKGRKTGSSFDRGFSLAKLIACTETKHTVFMAVLEIVLLILIIACIIWRAVKTFSKPSQ